MQELCACCLDTLEPHVPRSPVKTSSFVSQVDETPQRTAVDRSTPNALRMSLQEGSASVLFRQSGTEQLDKRPEPQVPDLFSTLPTQPRSFVTQRSQGY